MAACRLLDFQSQLRFVVGMRDLVGTAAVATHPDPALGTVPVGGHGGPELLPRKIRVRQYDNLIGPDGEQRSDSGIPGGAAYGVKKLAHLVGAIARLNHHNPVRAAEVIAKNPGPIERLGPVCAPEHLGDQVASQPRLGLGEGSAAGPAPWRAPWRVCSDRYPLSLPCRLTASCRTSTPTTVPPSRAAENRRSPSLIGPAAAIARRSSLSRCLRVSLG